jgi:hypothetical protein
MDGFAMVFLRYLPLGLVGIVGVCGGCGGSSHHGQARAGTSVAATAQTQGIAPLSADDSLVVISSADARWGSC